MFHIIGAMAEFEWNVISARARAGLDAARARGRYSGRPRAIDKIEPRKLARAKQLYADKNTTIAEIMHMTSFKSRNTFYKKEAKSRALCARTSPMRKRLYETSMEGQASRLPISAAVRIVAAAICATRS